MHYLSFTMMRTLYGKFYDLYPLYAVPGDQGHTGVARDRVYVIMVLKGKVEPIIDVRTLYDKVSKFIQKYVSTKPSDYFVSSQSDIMMEANKTASLRKIPLRRALWSELENETLCH